MHTKNYFLKSFSAYYFLKVHLHHFSKIKVQKKPQNSRNEDFSYCFCLLTKGSLYGSGSILLSNGSRSGRLKNMWIRIRIRNTAFWHFNFIFVKLYSCRRKVRERAQHVSLRNLIRWNLRRPEKEGKTKYYSKHRFLVSQILSSLGLPCPLTFKSYFEMNSNFFYQRMKRFIQKMECCTLWKEIEE